MPTNYFKTKSLARLQIVALNADLEIPGTGTPVLDSTSSIQSIGMTHQVGETGAETTYSVDGNTCIDSAATYSNQGKQISLLGCGINRELEAAMGWYQAASVSDGGWDEIDPDNTKTLLVVMTYKLPSSALIISHMHAVTAWRPDNGAATMDGQNTMHGNWIGDTIKVPAADVLFANFTSAGDPSGEFAQWVDYFPAGYLGTAWSKQTDAVAAPTWGTAGTAFRALVD